MKSHKNNILITGANGFIGSHLVDQLILQGYSVTAVDLHNAPSENLQKSIDSPKFNYYRCDLSQDLKLINKIVSKSDYIFHLAAIVGVQNYLINPQQMFNSNILGSYNVIESAMKYSVPLMFASTSEIYGKNPDVPWSEDSNRVLGSTSKDRWSYGTGKALIEHLLISLGKSSSLNFKIVRFFNVYGPRQKPIFVVSRAISRTARGLPVEVFDSGDQTRSFIYISDTVSALIELMNLDNQDPNKLTFNIGSGEEISIKQLYLTIKELIPSTNLIQTSTELTYGLSYEDLNRRFPNTSRLAKAIDWEPKINLKEGLYKTIKWVEENSWWLELDSEFKSER